MQPKGGVTLIIALGGGKPPPKSHVNHKGCDMIKIPIDSLITDSEEGGDVAPEIGDVVILETVEGEVISVNEDGSAHVELTSAGGEPIEYVEGEVALEDAEAEVDAEVDDMAGMEEQLIAAAAAQDEEQGL